MISQCPVNTTVGTKSTLTVAVAGKADGRSDTIRQHHLSKVTQAPQYSYVAVARHLKHRSQYLDPRRCETKYNAFLCSSLMYYQSVVLDVSSCATRFPSTRVRIPATLGRDNEEYQVIIDSATDIPCIAQKLICNHAKLRYSRVLPIPPGALLLRSADGSPLKMLGCIRFANNLGNKSLPVEDLVLPHLGPDAMLIDNSITKAFVAKLDWAVERLSFEDSGITIPATHTRQSFRSKYCSVITQDSDTKDVSVFFSNKYAVPAAHAALIRVFSAARPQKDTLALIEPKIATADTIKDIPQDKIWHSLIVARTVTSGVYLN